MDNCIDKTIEYCVDRKAFGKRIIDNQAIQFRLSELKTEVEAVRSLVYRACQNYVSGEDVTLLASMAKLKSSRLVREVADTWCSSTVEWDLPGKIKHQSSIEMEE